MDYFYPLNGDLEKDPLLDQTPEKFRFAAIIFYPFVKMPIKWKAKKGANPHAYPSNKDILKYGKPVYWNEIRDKSGLNNIAEMSIAVKSAISGESGRQIYQRPDLAIQMNDCLYKNIFYPLEDRLSIFQIDGILKILSSKGAKRIKYTKIHGEEGTYEINSIKTNDAINLCSGPITNTDENEDFVVACYFDEVSALCLAKEDIRDLLRKTKLEGIILDEKTPLVWEKYKVATLNSLI
ncbi:DUF2711 family protein [Pseudalkalibacillus sp. Hm43]|uniref:DUF2711 family protein n=1 Tax=Pseudalkalibacillus sp. Hm43 TaxID=3450742 RepID=UPI003F43F6A7